MLQRPEAFLLLLLLLPLLLLRKKKKNQLGFPNLKGLTSKIPQASWMKRNLLKILEALTITLFVIALANPLQTVEKSREVKETRLIVIVEDLSGSMYNSVDYYNPSLGSRHILALDSAHKFAGLRFDNTKEPSSDYLALIAFADYSKLICPFTNDMEIIHRRIEFLKVNDGQVGGGTEISEAVWLTINLFINYLPKEERPTVGEIMSMKEALIGNDEGDIWLPKSLKGKDFGKGKIAIILSDGEFYISSAYDIRGKTPNAIRAIRLMRMLGIKSYFILMNPQVDPRLEKAITSAKNEKELRTAGQILALKPDMSNIDRVYDKINELEKTQLILEDFRQKKGTSWAFTLLGFVSLVVYAFLSYSKPFRRIEI
ncbi:VWA domain-containing protein [Candidatus Woesearchaeota archaeon]|nr:VWA domain-containing protein [Candidatus Woesearchaeota archaeon]